jgi:DNA-binding transcriptional LysR family regulator
MEIEDLRLFAAIAQRANLTEAARQLQLPKSSASRSIARLEQALGISLLYRSNRKILLTEAGTLFLEHASAILERLDEANSVLDDLRNTPRGSLKVSAPVNPGQFMIAPLVGRFLDQYPDIDLSLTLTGEAVEPLTGDVDVAIRTGELRDSSLMARRLGVAHLGLYASPAYLAARGVPNDPEELGGHDLMDIAARGDFWKLSSAARTTQIRVAPRLLVNDTTVVKTILLSGFGLGWLPTYMCQEEIKDGRLQRVLTDWSRGQREIHALFACHRLISPKVRVFIDFIAQHLQIPR